MSERGSMMPMLMALVFAGLVVLGLATDIAVLASTYREAAFAADAGSEAGASVIAEGAAYDGELVLDPQAAEAAAVAAALAARNRPERTAAATAQDARICTTVTQPYAPRFIGRLGIGQAEVTVTSCAAPRQG